MRVDPITDEEWEVAALLARGALLFHSAKQYGLVVGPVVDVPRCEELLARAKARGIEVYDDHEAALAFLAGAKDPEGL